MVPLIIAAYLNKTFFWKCLKGTSNDSCTATGTSCISGVKFHYFLYDKRFLLYSCSELGRSLAKYLLKQCSSQLALCEKMVQEIFSSGENFSYLVHWHSQVPQPEQCSQVPQPEWCRDTSQTFFPFQFCTAAELYKEKKYYECLKRGSHYKTHQRISPVQAILMELYICN